MYKKLLVGSVKTPKALDALTLRLKEILAQGKSFHYSIEVVPDAASLTVDDYLQSAIEHGALQRVGDSYQWAESIPRGVIALWVDTVAQETGIKCKWRWAEGLFGHHGLRKRLQEAKDNPRYVAKVNSLMPF